MYLLAPLWTQTHLKMLFSIHNLHTSSAFSTKLIIEKFNTNRKKSIFLQSLFMSMFLRYTLYRVTLSNKHSPNYIFKSISTIAWMKLVYTDFDHSNDLDLLVPRCSEQSILPNQEYTLITMTAQFLTFI